MYLFSHIVQCNLECTMFREVNFLFLIFYRPQFSFDLVWHSIISNLITVFNLSSTRERTADNAQFTDMHSPSINHFYDLTLRYKN